MGNMLVYIGDYLFSIPTKSTYKSPSGLFTAELADGTVITIAEGGGKFYCVEYDEKSPIMQNILTIITSDLGVKKIVSDDKGVVRVLK